MKMLYNEASLRLALIAAAGEEWLTMEPLEEQVTDAWAEYVGQFSSKELPLDMELLVDDHLFDDTSHCLADGPAYLVDAERMTALLGWIGRRRAEVLKHVALDPAGNVTMSLTGWFGAWQDSFAINMAPSGGIGRFIFDNEELGLEIVFRSTLRSDKEPPGSISMDVRGYEGQRIATLVVHSEHLEPESARVKPDGEASAAHPEFELYEYAQEACSQAGLEPAFWASDVGNWVNGTNAAYAGPGGGIHQANCEEYCDTLARNIKAMLDAGIAADIIRARSFMGLYNSPPSLTREVVAAADGVIPTCGCIPLYHVYRQYRGGVRMSKLLVIEREERAGDKLFLGFKPSGEWPYLPKIEWSDERAVVFRDDPVEAGIAANDVAAVSRGPVIIREYAPTGDYAVVEPGGGATGHTSSDPRLPLSTALEEFRDWAREQEFVLVKRKEVGVIHRTADYLDDDKEWGYVKRDAITNIGLKRKDI